MKLKPIKININGKPCIVWEHVISLADVVELAGIDMGKEWLDQHRAPTIFVDNGYSINCEHTAL